MKKYNKGIPAVAYSWPSAVYITFNYKALVSLKGTGSVITLTTSASCGGILIDSNTILTAAHCIIDQISFSFNSFEYDYTVQANQFYPTTESMYTVYLGLYNRSNTNLDALPPPAIRMSISKITMVSFLYK